MKLHTGDWVRLSMDAFAHDTYGDIDWLVYDYAPGDMVDCIATVDGENYYEEFYEWELCVSKSRNEGKRIVWFDDDDRPINGQIAHCGIITGYGYGCYEVRTDDGVNTLVPLRDRLYRIEVL